MEEGENLSRKRVGGKCNGFQKQSIEFNIKVTTWLVVSTCFNPFEKYEFVNWDDDIPNVQKNKKHVPDHQPVTHDNHYKLPTLTSVYPRQGVALSKAAASLAKEEAVYRTSYDQVPRWKRSHIAPSENDIWVWVKTQKPLVNIPKLNKIVFLILYWDVHLSNFDGNWY